MHVSMQQLCVHICMCVLTCACVYMHLDACILKSASAHMQTSLRMNTCVWKHMSVHTCIY